MKIRVWLLSLLLLIAYFSNEVLARQIDADVHANQLKKADTLDFNFNVIDLSGKSISLNKWKGKFVLINLWATWCGPCRVEMPHLQKLYTTFEHPDFEIITFSLDKQNQVEKVKSYLSRSNYTFNVFFPDKDFPDVLKVKSIPSSFLIDDKGKIVWQHTGVFRFDKSSFKKKLRQLMHSNEAE